MGFIICSVMIMIETIFLFWNLFTETVHKREKGITSIVLFVAFIAIAITSLVTWGIRYYFLFLFLFIQALMGLYRLVRRKRNIPLKSKVRTVMKYLLICMGVFFVLLPILIFPSYEELSVTGNYEIETTLISYVDTNRIESYDDSGDYREVNVRVWYPKEEIKGCPFVLFSHGFCGVNMTNVSLFEELASNGYVVCSIDHPYQSYFTKNTEGEMTLISSKYQQQYAEIVETENAKKVYELMSEWIKIREADMNFVLDSILDSEIEIGEENWADKIDAEKIAVCGHSLGGSAALGIGRFRSDIDAVIALESPYISDIIGVNQDKNEFIWKEELYPVPVLNIYSDSVWGNFAKAPLYKGNEKALNENKGMTRNLYMEGIGHLDLTDLSLVAPFLSFLLDSLSGHEDTHHALEYINENSLQFLNYYLKGEGVKPDMH